MVKDVSAFSIRLMKTVRLRSKRAKSVELRLVFGLASGRSQSGRQIETIATEERSREICVRIWY